MLIGQKWGPAIGQRGASPRQRGTTPKQRRAPNGQIGDPQMGKEEPCKEGSSPGKSVVGAGAGAGEVQ